MKPNKLVKGSSIGIVSPSGPIDREELEKGIEILKEMGFHTKLGYSIYASSQYDYMAGNDEERCYDLNSMLMSKEIRAIMCSRGGYGSMRLLENIDYEAIEKNPKIVVGYSDITAIIIAIYRNTGLITFHGPVVRDLPRLLHTDVEWFISLLEGKKDRVYIRESYSIVSGKAKGILLGGNLSIICHLIATPFMPSTKELILFIEDVNEPYYKIDRMLTYLKISGFLNNVSALILGSFEGCGRRDIIEQIVFERVSELGFPVLSGFPIGHGNSNVMLPVGIKAELNTDTRELIFLEKPVT